MEPEDLLPRSQNSATGTYRDSGESIHILMLSKEFSL